VYYRPSFLFEICSGKYFLSAGKNNFFFHILVFTLPLLIELQYYEVIFLYQIVGKF